jgi:probable rRNA maturation factor
VSVVFVGRARMRQINSEYRGKDYATDVLSFAYHESTDELPFLGEIVVAPDVARENAEQWSGAPEKEVRKLILHGLLHLAGYDHETDQGEMNRLQAKLMRRRAFVGASPILRTPL